MMRTLRRVLKIDKERYKVPRKVQEIIPVKRGDYSRQAHLE